MSKALAEALKQRGGTNPQVGVVVDTSMDRLKVRNDWTNAVYWIHAYDVVAAMGVK